MCKNDSIVSIDIVMVDNIYLTVVCNKLQH